MVSWARVVVLGICCAAPVAALGESVFSFENIAAGTAVPLALSVNGLTASFSGNAAVCVSRGYTGDLFVSLTGNALMQGFCKPLPAGPVSVSFSSPLSKLSFALALNGTNSVPVTVTYLDHGVQVGLQTVNPVVPNGATSPEANVSYTGTFDAVTIASAGLMALGNFDAVPYPTSPVAPVGQ